MRTGDPGRLACLSGLAVADLHGHFDIRRDHPGLLAGAICDGQTCRRPMMSEGDVDDENCYDEGNHHGDKVPDT